MPVDTTTRNPKRIEVNAPLRRKLRPRRDLRTKTWFDRGGHREQKHALTAVFMPVRHEQETIGRNLDALLEAGKAGHINKAIIVVDGSNAKTKKIIEEKLGIEIGKPGVADSGIFSVITHPRSLGKGTAFLSCLRELENTRGFYNNRNSVLVNIDADAQDLSAKKIQVLSDQLRKRNLPMLVARHVNNENRGLARPTPVYAKPEGCSFRAITAIALRPFIEEKPKYLDTLPARHGLEHALNLLLLANPREVLNFESGRAHNDAPAKKVELFPVDISRNSSQIILHHGPANREEHSINEREVRKEDAKLNKKISAKFAQLRFLDIDEQNNHFTGSQIWHERVMARKMLQLYKED